MILVRQCDNILAPGLTRNGRPDGPEKSVEVSGGAGRVDRVRALDLVALFGYTPRGFPRRGGVSLLKAIRESVRFCRLTILDRGSHVPANPQAISFRVISSIRYSQEYP